MGPFRRKEFKKSPLAPNVPLEGSDTVLGLRQLERQRLAEASPFRTLAPDRLFQSNPGRRNYTRYKGPFLEETRLDSLRAPPRPWPQFLHHGANSSVIVAYNVPEDVRMLCERLDENLVYYLVNYIYVALAVLLLLVLFRPTAIIGLGVSAASLYFNLVLVPSLPPLQQEDSNIATVKMVLMILSWVAALYTRCMELGSAGWQLSLVLAVQLQQVVQHYWLQLDDALRYRSGWRYPRRVRTYPVQ
ncbi:hypothetical protein WJX72_011400 [[Myrmecia] bisecta]|uniref:PRA1 family protein n=1 Tax=[Myrmecia] bisecta TaxID=41462 RepID=A0AAW1PXW1_9CHLO